MSRPWIEVKAALANCAPGVRSAAASAV